MSHFEAHQLLDKVKDGKNVPLYLINKALELTGDLESTPMAYSRKNISNESDRVVLEKAEAREIFRSWQTNRDNDFVRARLERCERIYGSGARDRVRFYMRQMKEGQIE